MTRDQEEHYAQDRRGDVNRKIDPVRGQGGMDMGPEIDGDRYPQGLINYSDTGTNEILYIIPPDVDSVSISEIQIHNKGDSSSTYSLFEGTLDPNLTEVNSETIRRSVPIRVEPGKSRMLSYTGMEFGCMKVQSSSTNTAGYGAILASGGAPADIGVGVYNHSPEEKEPASEQAENIPGPNVQPL